MHAYMYVYTHMHTRVYKLRAHCNTPTSHTHLCATAAYASRYFGIVGTSIEQSLQKKQTLSCKGLSVALH